MPGHSGGDTSLISFNIWLITQQACPPNPDRLTPPGVLASTAVYGQDKTRQDSWEWSLMWMVTHASRFHSLRSVLVTRESEYGQWSVKRVLLWTELRYVWSVMHDNSGLCSHAWHLHTLSCVVSSHLNGVNCERPRSAWLSLD